MGVHLKRKIEEDDLQKVASSAVSTFQSELDVLLDMRAEFAKKFPDAHAELEEIKNREDLVRDLATRAKEKVAAAGVTVGPFEVTRAFSKPGFDDEALVQQLLSIEDGGELFILMARVGVIKSVSTDKTATNTFLAQNPDHQQKLQPAWKDKKELTPRVSVPKF